MVFTELKNKYLREHSPKKSLKQYIRDKGIFENHLDPYLKDYLLPEITSDVVSDYKAKRREEGAEPGTINRELNLLKHCLLDGMWRMEAAERKSHQEREIGEGAKGEGAVSLRRGIQATPQCLC